MPTLTALLRKDFNAAADIEPNRIVKITATGVTTAINSTDAAIGITYPAQAVKAGQMADVIMVGIAEVTAGGGIAVGDFVTADSQGRGVTATAGNIVVGRALKAATGADEIIPIAIGVFK